MHDLGSDARHPEGEHPRSELELHADAVRSHLLSVVATLEQRGRDALDVKLQLHRHAVAAGVLAGVLVLALFGGAALTFLDSRKEARHPLWHALRRALRHPERIAPESGPTHREVVRKIALAIALSILSPLAKRYARRVFA
jgi:hypothetical protein